MSIPEPVAKLIRHQAYVNGQWVDSRSGKTFPVFNPATNERITQVPDQGQEDTREAISAAHTAFPAWKSLTPKERSAILKRWAMLVNDNLESLATILTMEQGKAFAEARGEVASSVAYIEWFANEAMRVTGETLPRSANGNFEYMQKLPIGVVAAITPWNFPNSMIARKVAPALAAGCTVVIKPAEDTPLSALALTQLATDAGVPAGVINVITASSGAEVGLELSKNPTVKKLSFTGSTAVGKILLKQCASTVKKLSLELGGNAPFIVFEDADLDAAVQGAISIKFYNSGQTCVCANRLLIQNGIHDEFLKKYNEAIATKLVQGHGLQENVSHGPLINEKAITKIQNLVDSTVSEGATVYRGGNKLPHLGPNFFEFTVLTNVEKDMEIFRSEIFGPIAAVYKFATEEEAVALANDTPYGLASYLYTKDTGRIFRVSEALEYGMVGVNTPRFVSETVPFGGVKESGIGREGSSHGIDEFLEMHYVCIKT
ncbi:succinate-semialdehyde dehydrogenase / glutarate-semialdehyde dehydrogenase [Marinobacter sp. DSM 26671]|uniref:NAD-dependent succinate-semialdehyde dehydrogenase n=1 Tax=Marinobacter sp. DSM 26671 TaxID=1761793 RepID=UPI0008E0E730|nr:NAD-dependent succinate-semialdehyde dehydrogenase [Marinobacter sp. DSM 26671]SFE98418.1 succinate-semialdehyde dehydrogenase / glutarate-semialdehyde dehydrogenase [Marinobacter sp. DSM 26671]